jgi:hypothetical protein
MDQKHVHSILAAEINKKEKPEDTLNQVHTRDKQHTCK